LTETPGVLSEDFRGFSSASSGKYAIIPQFRLLWVPDIFLSPSSHTQLKIQGKICYIFRLEQAIIRPITETLKRKKLLKLQAGERSQIFTM
jgi:hypothetical protein